MTVIAVTAIFDCLVIYVIALVRALITIRSFQIWLDGLMEKPVDWWVGSNRFLIKALALTEFRFITEMPKADRDSWYVITSNHQSWADILILQVIFRDVSPIIKFFTKRELIWAPFVGIAMYLLGFPYVQRKVTGSQTNREKLHESNKKSMLRARDRFIERPVAVLSFLEGTRFTPEKHQRTASPYKHLLKPKIGGFAFTLDHLEERRPKILDVTLLYEGEVPSFWDFLCGKCRQVQIDIQSVDTIPLQPNALNEWLTAHWQEKDNHIDQLKASFHK